MMAPVWAIRLSILHAMLDSGFGTVNGSDSINDVVMVLKQKDARVLARHPAWNIMRRTMEALYGIKATQLRLDVEHIAVT